MRHVSFKTIIKKIKMLQYQLKVTWLSLKYNDFITSNTEKQKNEARNPSPTNFKRSFLSKT